MVVINGISLNALMRKESAMLSPTIKRRRLRFYNFMMALPRKKFNFRIWGDCRNDATSAQVARFSEKGPELDNCGTVACAAGWARECFPTLVGWDKTLELPVYLADENQRTEHIFVTLLGLSHFDSINATNGQGHFLGVKTPKQWAKAFARMLRDNGEPLHLK